MFFNEVVSHFSNEKVELDGVLYSCQIDVYNKNVYKLVSGYSLGCNLVTRISTNEKLILEGPSVDVAFNGSIVTNNYLGYVASNVGVLSRKSTVGSGDDLGWLVSLPEYTIAYYSEPMASSSDEERSMSERILVKLDKDVDIAQWDFISNEYRVESVYSDRGVKSAICIKEPDNRVDFTITDKSTSTFNNTTLEYEIAPVSRNVSGYVVEGQDFPAWSKQGDSESVICVHSKDIGFTPKVGSYVTHNGISKLVTSHSYSYQNKTHLLVVK